jgi:glutathione S-transferase
MSSSCGVIGDRVVQPSGKLTVYHIPVCPFCQRLEILLTLKGRRDAIDFHVIDITQPRPAWLTERTRGTTALPVLETEDGTIIKESLVIMRYLEDRFPSPAVAQRDPVRRAMEEELVAGEGGFGTSGYRFVMNQDPNARDGFHGELLTQYAKLNGLLSRHSPEGPFLFGQFGWAEAVFTPLFMRFWFLDYYEGFELPADLARVRAWRDACMAHPAAQQVSKEEIVKVYYDYAKGAGNGALLPSRTKSSFAFEPHWSKRPWPPRDKYHRSASDEELGLD